MNQQPGKLGIREYVSITVLMLGAKATEAAPSLLYSTMKNSAWMAPILSSAIFFIPLFLLIKTVTLYQGKNLFEAMEQLLGKYIGFILCFMILVISILGISSDSRTYADIIRSYYFPKTPVLVLFGLFMAVCAYCAKKGLLHIGSTAYIIIFYVIISLYFALALSTQDSNIQGIFPFWGPGKLAILKNSSQRLHLFSEFFLFTMLIPYLKTVKDFRRGTWISYSFVTVHLSIATLIFICLFDVSLDGLGYPFHTAIRYISLGSYIPNLEIFFFIIWIMGTMIRFAAFLYITALMFGNLFKIKDFEYLIPPLAAIFLMIGSMPESSLDARLEWRSLLQSVIGPLFASISLLIWFVALLKGEFKHAKSKNNL